MCVHVKLMFSHVLVKWLQCHALLYRSAQLNGTFPFFRLLPSQTYGCDTIVLCADDRMHYTLASFQLGHYMKTLAAQKSSFRERWLVIKTRPARITVRTIMCLTLKKQVPRFKRFI
jgi:hypothetical protein